MSFPEFQVKAQQSAPNADPGRAAAFRNIERAERCQVCREGRLYNRQYRRANNPVLLFLAYQWAFFGSMAAIATFCFGIYTVINETTSGAKVGAAIVLGFFTLVFVGIGLLGWWCLMKISILNVIHAEKRLRSCRRHRRNRNLSVRTVSDAKPVSATIRVRTF